MAIKLKAIDNRIGTVFPLPEAPVGKPPVLYLIACIDHALVIHPGAKAVLVPTGMAINIEDAGVAAMMVPSPSDAHESGMVLGDTVRLSTGEGYQSIMVSVWNRDKDTPIILEPGARIAQMVFLPILRPEIELA